VEPDITITTSHFIFIVVGASAVTNPANDVPGTIINKSILLLNNFSILTIERPYF